MRTTTPLCFDEALPLDLIERYNRPGPRYTSYPTAPHFTDAFGPDDYAAALHRLDGRNGPGLSLYVHLPFCRSLCTYCGCHMRVTHRRATIAHYLTYLMREIAQTAERMPNQIVRQVHWGGGTPTYLLPDEIEMLLGHLRRHFTFARDAEVSLEADPRGLTRQHLDAARRAGFNRISFGVQDLDPVVQEAIGRIQPREMVERATDWAHELGFESVSYDLIYGLPHQTVERFDATLGAVLDLAPARLSLFSYAHVPWMKRHQRLIHEDWLPTPHDKLRIMLHARARLIDGGYRAIGMDHFARPDDALSHALDDGTLHRNFQGYTTHAGSDLVAFGISGISQIDDVYAQNVKGLRSYYDAIDAGRPPVERGYQLDADDHLRRDVIMTLMCRFALDIPSVEARYNISFARYFADALEALRPMEDDGLVVCTGQTLTVTPIGRLLVRNVAMPFDRYFNPQPSVPKHAQTI